MPRRTVTLTQGELSDRLGLTTRQVRGLTKLGLPREGAPSGKGRGGRFRRYLWPQARDWYFTFKKVRR